MPEKKIYLGDSVYCEIHGEMLKLTTDNGLGPSNTIYLEPYVLRSLAEYARTWEFRLGNDPERAESE